MRQSVVLQVALVSSAFASPLRFFGRDDVDAGLDADVITEIDYVTIGPDGIPTPVAAAPAQSTSDTCISSSTLMNSSTTAAPSVHGSIISSVPVPVSSISAYATNVSLALTLPAPTFGATLIPLSSESALASSIASSISASIASSISASLASASASTTSHSYNPEVDDPYYHFSSAYPLTHSPVAPSPTPSGDPTDPDNVNDPDLTNPDDPTDPDNFDDPEDDPSYGGDLPAGGLDMEDQDTASSEDNDSSTPVPKDQLTTPVPSSAEPTFASTSLLSTDIPAGTTVYPSQAAVPTASPTADPTPAADTTQTYVDQCKTPSAALPALATPTGDSLPAWLLYYHNLHRRNHSAPDMAWSAELERDALIQVSLHNATGSARPNCTGGHVAQINNDQYGQNIAAAGGGGSGAAVMLGDLVVSNRAIAKSATDMWYAEGATWGVNFYGGGGEENHFTQMVWKESTLLGCGVQQCGYDAADSHGSGYWMTCNYLKVGNNGDLSQVGSALCHPPVEDTEADTA